MPRNFVIVVFFLIYFSSLIIYKIGKFFFLKPQIQKILKKSNEIFSKIFEKSLKIPSFPSIDQILKGDTWTWDVLEFFVLFLVLKVFSRRRISFKQQKIIFLIIFNRLIRREVLKQFNFLVNSNLKRYSCKEILLFCCSIYCIIRFLKRKNQKNFTKEKRFYHLIMAIEINLFYLELSLGLALLLILYFQKFFSKKKPTYSGETFFAARVISSFIFANRFRILSGNFSRKKRLTYGLYLLYKFNLCHKEALNLFVQFRNYVYFRDRIYTRLRDPTETDIKQQFEKFCVVCRKEQLVPDFSKKLDCSHIVHAKCIHIWLTEQTGCPACTWPITFREREDPISRRKKTFQGIIRKPILGMFGFFFGYWNKKKINKDKKKKKSHIFFLPCLFPDTTNLLFWNFDENGTYKSENKLEYFRNLLKKTRKKYPNGFQITSVSLDAYFHILWIEERVSKLFPYSEQENLLTQKFINKREKFFNDQLKLETL
jgi:hypothetical protein